MERLSIGSIVIHCDKPAGRRGWVHLDLYTDDQGAEVDRLVRLGAARYPWRYPPAADYVVLADPDGNLFLRRAEARGSGGLTRTRRPASSHFRICGSRRSVAPSYE